MHLLQVRNLRIGAMMRTVLPAFAQAVVMNSSLEDTSQKLEKIQVKMNCSIPNFIFV